ncbi:cytochrome biogenesis protein [Vibrio sp. MACH09]|uniref:sulfite exporter TauE/SafE family protein n=1 Tax=unclassified Vibrio TaxID=2614977 RepID=UPI0014933C61|nr:MULTISPECIES: sulfite exporter TauE/SafE family protein [unclassified Vibrio]NOI65454.1 sulfite exporter TauE/SafE family protein [Vibrio sp. 99-8-1]GLO60966.1 cytochrome biogenesis protein [Vibrio sp. MACH09]
MNIDLIGALFVGFLGSAHCVGMCGGIASAMSINITAKSDRLLTILCYNFGRLSSYTLAGFVVGGAISSASSLVTDYSVLNWLRFLSAFVMIVLALHIGKWWQGIIYIEKLGQWLWRFINPIATKLLPLSSPFQALPLGFLWGWLPCGLVYSALTWAAVSGSGINGSLTMLAFGIGTLPSMLLVGISAEYVNRVKTSTVFRQIGAMLLLAYGGYIALSTFSLLS